MEYVIGSGPSGIACAQALLANGRQVTMLDAGLTLEPAREALRASMAQRPAEAWSPAERAERANPLGGNGDLPDFKLAHGSDYPYRPLAAAGLRINVPGVSASHAQGGLGNVWGASMLPYRPRDLAAWPVGAEEMAEAYRAVLRAMPLAGVQDRLAADWPLYTLEPREMPISRQATRLLARLQRHAHRLRQVEFGRSRLAVDAAGERLGLPCIACAECLNGCPRELIYSPRHPLPRLQAAGMTYIPGLVVRGIEETGDAVQLHAVDAAGASHGFTAGRVFVAAGVFGTTALMLRTLRIPRAEIRDSQYFLLPLLQWARTPDVAREKLHTLAQVFLEIEDPAVSPHNIHLQIYSYSPLLAAALAGKLGRLAPFFPRAALMERLMLVQGYLHSDHSGILEAKLEGKDVTVTARRNPETRKILRLLLRRMRRMSPALGGVPLGPALEETVPGRGFHSGGSFPMRAAPGPGETDRLGRPGGAGRIHLVDSSVFPDIPAATITLTAMANAWRIGNETARSAMAGEAGA